MKQIVVYSLELKSLHANADEHVDLELQKWVPSIAHIIPANAGFEYLLFWLAHNLRIFKNRSYSAYQFIDGGRVISSLVCVPPLFIWPFMKKNDIQIKAVFTHPDFRGKGLALKLIKLVKNDFIGEKMTLWYITHDQNTSSLRLCEKAGFKFAGYYRKSRKRFSIFGIGKLYSH